MERDTFEQMASRLQADLADDRRILERIKSGRYLQGGGADGHTLDWMITRLQIEEDWLTRRIGVLLLQGARHARVH